MRYAPLFAAAALAVSSPSFAGHHEGGHSLEHVLAGDQRGNDGARDQYRHPAETLAFFGVKPGMAVADFMPAGGWYTRVLVPYLGAEGRYVGLQPDPAQALSEGFRNYFGGLPAAFDEESPKWNLTGAPVTNIASQDIPDDMHGSLDRVLIFREMHNLHRSGILHVELSRIFDLLADDGMLGIVQHRAPEWASGDYTDGSAGYMRQSDVIGLVEAHGFRLVGTSEVNANPKDPANWDGGVWNLPPVYRNAPEGSEERARRAAIGESDRMTLLFAKRN